MRPASGSNRIKRGGSYNNSADNLQVGNRNNNNPYNENNNWEPDADVPRVAMDGHNGAANGFRLASLFSPARIPRRTGWSRVASAAYMVYHPACWYHKGRPAGLFFKRY